MANYLVIVESPAKVKTILKNFFSKISQVMASNGHVRDLPKSQLGFSRKMILSRNILRIQWKGRSFLQS